MAHVFEGDLPPCRELRAKSQCPMTDSLAVQELDESKRGSDRREIIAPLKLDYGPPRKREAQEQSSPSLPSPSTSNVQREPHSQPTGGNTHPNLQVGIKRKRRVDHQGEAGPNSNHAFNPAVNQNSNAGVGRLSTANTGYSTGHRRSGRSQAEVGYVIPRDKDFSNHAPAAFHEIERRPHIPELSRQYNSPNNPAQRTLYQEHHLLSIEYIPQQCAPPQQVTTRYIPPQHIDSVSSHQCHGMHSDTQNPQTQGGRPASPSFSTPQLNLAPLINPRNPVREHARTSRVHVPATGLITPPPSARSRAPLLFPDQAQNQETSDESMFAAIEDNQDTALYQETLGAEACPGNGNEFGTSLFPGESVVQQDNCANAQTNHIDGANGLRPFYSPPVNTFPEENLSVQGTGELRSIHVAKFRAHYRDLGSLLDLSSQLEYWALEKQPDLHELLELISEDEDHRWETRRWAIENG